MDPFPFLIIATIIFTGLQVIALLVRSLLYRPEYRGVNKVPDKAWQDETIKTRSRTDEKIKSK